MNPSRSQRVFKLVVCWVVVDLFFGAGGIGVGIWEAKSFRSQSAFAGWLEPLAVLGVNKAVVVVVEGDSSRSRSVAVVFIAG